MKYESKKKIGIGAGLSLGFICAIVVLYGANINDIVADNQPIERHGMFREVYLPFLGENDPGSGASGVLEVYINATGDADEYDTNISGTYASGDVNNSHISSDVPYDTAFDVVVKVRWNKTHAYDTAWNLSLVRAYANSTVLGVTAIQMNETQIADSANYLYVHYYLKDADGGDGSGFTIAEGENVTGFSVNFESLFYP